MRIIIALLAFIAAAGEAYSQQSIADHNQQIQFDQTYQSFLTFIDDKWKSEVVPNVHHTYPQADVNFISRIKAYNPMQPCQVPIQINRSNHTVPVSENYYAFISMYMQPFMLYVSGYKQFEDLQQVVDETVLSMETQTGEFRKNCKDFKPKDFYFHIPSFNKYFKSKEDFYQFIRQASTDPAAVNTAEEMASDAILFVMLHELGHEILHHEQEGANEEFQADQFASNVFGKMGRSTSYGAFGIIIYHGMTDPIARGLLACRLKQLFAQKFNHAYNSPMMAIRSDRLRIALQQHYAKTCLS